MNEFVDGPNPSLPIKHIFTPCNLLTTGSCVVGREKEPSEVGQIYFYRIVPESNNHLEAMAHNAARD